jgi:hypothetical protein
MEVPHAALDSAASPQRPRQASERGALSPGKTRVPLSSSGKTDLLLRFFGSTHFNAWIAVHYLHTAKSEVRTLLSARSVGKSTRLPLVCATLETCTTPTPT